MIWSLSQTKDIPRALNYIGGQEWMCEHLVSRLLRKQRQKEISPDVLWLGAENRDLCGLLYVSSSGLMLPYLPCIENRYLDTNFLQPLSEVLLAYKPKIYSIAGKLTFVKAIEEAIKIDGGIRVDYHLMTCENDDPLPPFPYVEDFKIRVAKLKDLEKLLPIQMLYEKEEVNIRPHSTDLQKIEKELQYALQEQIILLGEYKGQTVSKAGTNARGIRFDQIGGVFTAPAYRSRHFARALMIHLLQLLIKEKKNACLFVKTHNEPAIRLYKSLHFKIREAFRIHYLSEEAS